MEIALHSTYLSLGSNLGNRMENLNSAVSALKLLGSINRISSVYESTSWGYDSQNNYLNCCLELLTAFSPPELLQKTKEIERAMGRIKTEEYTDRIIDLDILVYGDLILNSEELTLPHPHIETRAFVLVPLSEIASDLFHNKHFLTIGQLLENCPSSESLHYYGSFKASNIN